MQRSESSKFGRRSLTRFAAREEVDLLVTDDNISEENAEKLTSCGIDIIKVTSIKQQ